MTNVRVAVRVRPFTQREIKEGGRIIVEVDGNIAKIKNLKVDSRPDGFGDSREKVVAFGFDYCYWSVNPEDPHYASQDMVFQDLGTEVLSGAAKGYNICLFAYGQTGSGKTYTMLGTPASVGLTPRICEGLFISEEDYAQLPSSCRIKVSFLEIYNERVRDLLKQSDPKKPYSLRVREHPEMGPYVQGLSQHVVTNYKQVIQLLEEGIANRITAATHVHEASSRSHAIFTIHYSQAVLENNFPSEIASKINLVDLAGSERADPSYCKDRITEGANINKSLVTLGIVISALAQNSQGFNDSQNLSSTVNNADDSGISDSPSGTRSGGGPSRRQSYIPYRDSVLTWLLKDSLGGNSKTIMVATVSPAHTSFSETMSTLRYASNAKNIINKPQVNEDANIKLIRELREEIRRLKAMLLNFELRNFSPSNKEKDENLRELVLQNEWKIDQLTKDWTQKWNEWKTLLEHYRVDINRKKVGVVIDSSLPHLMVLEDDVLSTGVVLYHLKEGITKIGRIDSDQEQDIVLQGQWIERDHCTITSACGVVVLRPTRGARCIVNGREVTASCRLTQGAVITLGKAQKFRFNHPAEAAVLRQRRQVGDTICSSGSLEWLNLDGDVTASQLRLCPSLWRKRRELEEQSEEDPQLLREGEPLHWAKLQKQQWPVEYLKQRILVGQLEGIIKKQRLLEAQKTLEQLQALSRLQDDQTQEPCFEVPSPEAMVPGSQCTSTSSYNSLNLLRLCCQYLPHLCSVFLNQDSSSRLSSLPGPACHILGKTLSDEYLSYPLQSGCFSRNALCSLGERKLCLARRALARKGVSAPGTCLPMISESPSTDEMERMSEQSHVVVFESSASLCQSASNLTPVDNTDTLTPSPQTRRAKRLSDSDKAPAEWQKDGHLETCKASRGTECFSYSWAPKEAAGCSKTAKPFWKDSKPPFLTRLLTKPQKVQATRVRDIVQPSSYLPHGSPSRRQHTAEDVDPITSLIDSNIIAEHERGKDAEFSDTDSNYSEDSLSCVCAKTLPEAPKPEDLQGQDQDLPEPDNHDSDDSQISEDSLAEKGSQSTQVIPGDSNLIHHFNRCKVRARAFRRNLNAALDTGLVTQVHRSFSLDSLIDAEEELEEDRQEESFFGSPHERPTETFWRLQTFGLPTLSQETVCKISHIKHRTGARLDTTRTVSSSFYLQPHPQPCCEQPELEAGASSSEQAHALQGLHLSRGSPLVSMDSWFSCDSRIHPSSTPGIVEPLCPSPDIHEFQPCGHVVPEYRLNMGEPKPSASEIVLPSDSKLPQDPTELPCRVRGACTVHSASNVFRLSLFQSHSLLQPGVGGTFQAGDIPGVVQPGSSEVSNSTTSFLHRDKTCEKDWTALQQKYLLELSHPVLEAIGEPRPATPNPDEECSSLTQTSDKGGNALEVPGSLDFNRPAVHLTKIRHLRAEKEQDSLSVDLEGTSDLLTASEKETNYSADVESVASGTTSAQVSAVENKRAATLTQAHQVKPNNLQECSQDSKINRPTPSHESFFSRTSCHNDVTTATEEDRWPRDWSPPRKNSTDKLEKLNHHPFQEEKVDYQESSKEVISRPRDASFSFISGPELHLHTAPQNSFSSSLRLPLLETFYVTKSRDALTETALEIPGCREARVPSPPLREAWGFHCDSQVLQSKYFKNNLPVLLQKQNSKVVSSQQVTAARPVDMNTREGRETGKYPEDIKEGSQKSSIYFSVPQNKPFVPPTSISGSEFESQVGISGKHSLLACKEGTKAMDQSCCSFSFDSSEHRRHDFVHDSETDREEEQSSHAVLTHSQTLDMNRQLPLRAKSDGKKPASLDLVKDMLKEPAVTLKSRLEYHIEINPEIVAQDESLTYKSKGKTGPRLAKTFHPKDPSSEFALSGADSEYERFQSVPCSQERNPSEHNDSGKLQGTLNTKEELSGKEQNKIANNADEMARLLKSVIQLENGILEIESKQSKSLSESHPSEVSERFIIQDQKDQEMAELLLVPENSRSHLFFRDQLFCLKQTNIDVYRDSDPGEIEFSSGTEHEPQVQKMAPRFIMSRERVQNIDFQIEHTHPATLDRYSTGICDYLRTHTDFSECSSTSVNLRRMEIPAHALPLQPWPSRTSENESASTSTRGQPCDLGSLEELESTKSFQTGHITEFIASSKSKESKTQDRVKMGMQSEWHLQEENKTVPSIQKLANRSLYCVDTSSNPETDPWLTLPDSSTAPSHQDLNSTLPLNSPRSPRSCLHAPDNTGISSVDYELDPMILKTHNSFLVTGGGHQDQNTETGSHNPQETIGGHFPMEPTVWHESIISAVMGSDSQSSVPESTPLGTESKMSASTSTQDHGDLRSKDLQARMGSTAETETVAQTSKTSSLNRVFRQCEKKTSSPLEEDRELKQKAAKEPQHFSDAFLAPVFLPVVPHSEPSTHHLSTCTAVLEESRQETVQGKQLHGCVTRGTVLPYYETLLEHECSLRVPSRPQCQPMVQSVSNRTRDPRKAQGLHVPSLSTEPGHLPTDERKTLQATTLSADDAQLLPHSGANAQLWQLSQASSYTALALDQGHCSGEPRHLLVAGEQSICNSSSSKIGGREREAASSPASTDPSSASLENRKIIHKKEAEALFSQTHSDDDGVSLLRQSPLSAWSAAGDRSLDNQGRRHVHQEPATLGSVSEGSSHNFSVDAQRGITTYFKSQPVVHDQNSASLLESSQDHVQCLEASPAFERQASPQQGAVWHEPLRRVELKDFSAQFVKLEGSVGCGLSEACRPGSHHSVPTPLPDQSPGSDATDLSQTISSSGRQEYGSILHQWLCSPQAISSHAYSSPSLCDRDGDLGKKTSKAVPHPLHPPCRVSAKACGADKRGESDSRGLDMSLVSLKFRGIHEQCEPTESRSLGPSAQNLGYSSPSAPDVKTCSFNYLVADGNSRLVRDPERKVAEKKTRRDLEATPFSAGLSSEPTRKFQDSSEGDHSAQVCQTKPRSPGSELMVESQHECLEVVIRCLSEKLQLSPEFKNHSALDLQAQLVAKLKHITPLADGLWEEEEQQKDEVSEGSVQGRSPPLPSESGPEDCQLKDAGREKPVTQSPTSKSPTEGLPAQSPTQHSFHSEQTPPPPPPPPHRHALPVIENLTHSTRSKFSPKSQFSVISSSRSLQELNLSVEPPSPTAEDTSEPNKLWDLHLGDHSLGKSATEASQKANSCSQKAASSEASGTIDHRSKQPASPPYPISLALSCMPTPHLMTGGMYSVLEQAQQRKPEDLGDQVRPEKGLSEADNGMLYFGSSNINPYIFHWRPEEPACIGWKPYVFSSAVDISHCQVPRGLTPLSMVRCSSVDRGLEEQNSSFQSHFSTYANARSLSNTNSSTENARGSSESWEVWGSLALGCPRILTDPESTVPTKGAEKKTEFPGSSEEANCPRDKSLAEGSAMGSLDEIVLLCPSEAGGQARLPTLEQSTQTLNWSCDEASAQPEGCAVPFSDLASWTSMHNLSLHLSQLLHKSSELLGSLSQPSSTEKERDTKKETPDESVLTRVMDGCTQTTKDESVQTDLVSPPPSLLAPEISPQEGSVVLEELDSGLLTTSQEEEKDPEPLQKRETEEMEWNVSEPLALQKESLQCRPQSPPYPSPPLSAHEATCEQNLPSESPQASPDISLLPDSQPEELSCLDVSNCSLSPCPSPCPNSVEPVGEPSIQKEWSPSNALLVDRASSPILILSATPQESGIHPDSLSLPEHLAQSLEGLQKPGSSPGLPPSAPRPPTDSSSHSISESGSSPRVPYAQGRSPLERNQGRSFLEVNSPGIPQSSLKPQVRFLDELPLHLQPRTTAWLPSRPLLRSRNQGLADGGAPEDTSCLECDPLSSGGPANWQSRAESRSAAAAAPAKPQAALSHSTSWRGHQHHSPGPISELADSIGVQSSTLDLTEGLLHPGSQGCMMHESQHHSLKDLPVHNKFNNWCGVQDDSPEGLGMELPGSRHNFTSGEQEDWRPPHPADHQNHDPDRFLKEQIPLQVGVQNLSLSIELTEAKLHHGFGEADALLQILEAGTEDEPPLPSWEKHHTRKGQTVENPPRQRAERPQPSCQTRSLSPLKQLSLLPGRELPTRDHDLPSRRREYLQQLRKDVVETTRSPGSTSRSAQTSSDIETLLRDYHRAREEAKMEIARAQARLWERTEQEKLRIRQQIISQLLKEEEKLHTPATPCSASTSSDGSLCSGVTSGYNSSPALPVQLQSPDSVGDTNLLGSKDSWIGNMGAPCALRSSHPSLSGAAWKSSTYSSRNSLGSCCYSSVLSGMGSTFSSSYQDLAKHIVDITMADVMAACSDNLLNLFSRQAAAGWNYQGEEQEVKLYYKVFSSTRHGFLGAGVVPQPLSHVWAAVSDPTLWPLYHKPIQTARLHQRVTNNINLVYLVCSPTLCALKQPRDFCCVCVEAKEGHLSIMAAQSVYDKSMPRPSREMVRGEILPSAWILQPLTMDGKQITRVIYLAQVELGAPGFPPQLLSSFVKQQPLIIARLASFLGS